MHPRKKTAHQKGNVIFIILLGVFLFGALTFSVTKGMRTGEVQTLEEDKAALYAGEMMAYAQAIKEAIDRMRMLHGVKDYEFDFATGYEDFVSDGVNSTCTTNKCRLFHPEGGAAKPRLIPDEFYDHSSRPYNPLVSSVLHEIAFYGVEVPDIGSAADDLVLVIKGIHPQICAHINKEMAGIPYGTGPDNDIYGDWESWSGPYTSFPNPAGSIDPAIYRGQKTFCMGHSTYSQIFIHVLIER